MVTVDLTSTPDYTEDDENVRRAKQHEMRRASDDEEKSQFYERVASSQRIPMCDGKYASNDDVG